MPVFVHSLSYLEQNSWFSQACFSQSSLPAVEHQVFHHPRLSPTPEFPFAEPPSCISLQCKETSVSVAASP
ncbi:hypothetical protein CGRA01v4_13684 [Colletotrichum graminicola]|nr:hypothetical protein CGRA01v4_13684 [Colletotrichum graminicola]